MYGRSKEEFTRSRFQAQLQVGFERRGRASIQSYEEHSANSAARQTLAINMIGMPAAP